MTRTGRAGDRGRARWCSPPRASRRGRVSAPRLLLARGRARPAGRVPGLDAARRADRGRGADAGQDAAGAAGRADAVRRQRAARAGVPGAAARLRRDDRGGARGGAAAAGRATSLAMAARGARQRRRCCATPPATARSCCARRIPLRYRRIVVRAEGDGRVESVTHAAVDARLAGDRRHRGDRRGRHALPRLRVRAVGRAAAAGGLRLRLRRGPRRAGGRASTSGCARASPGVLAAGDGTGVEGVVRARSTRGGSAALGAALDLGAISAAPTTRPIRARLARRRAFRRTL